MMKLLDRAITENDLRQFTGSDTFFCHSLVRAITYTEGVQFLAEQAGAHWLVDKIATLQLDPKVRAEEFQVWKLSVDGTAATLTCTDGDKGDGPVTVHREKIEFTDFPLPEVTLYLRDRVIMLPSEY